MEMHTVEPPECGHLEIRTPLVYWTLRLVPMQYKHVLFHP